MNHIATALKDALEDIDGLTVFDFVPDSLVPPAVFLSFPELTYDADMSDDHIATYRIHLVLSRAHDRSAYEAFGPYIAPSGIKAVLEADPTLDNAVDDVRVTSASVGPIQVAGTDFLAATFICEIYFTEAEGELS